MLQRSPSARATICNAEARSRGRPERFRGSATLVLQLRADLGITLNGSNVSAWADQSGQGHNVTQGTASLQPLFIPNAKNGQPGVRCDGVDDFLKASAFTLNQVETALVVYKYLTINISGTHDIAFDGNGNGFMAFAVNSTPQTVISAGTGVAWASLSGNGVYAYATCTFNGASSELRVGGVSRATGNAGAANAGGFTFGALADGSRSANVEVTEIILYNRALAAAEIVRAEAYLKARYAL